MFPLKLDLILTLINCLFLKYNPPDGLQKQLLSTHFSQFVNENNFKRISFSFFCVWQKYLSNTKPPIRINVLERVLFIYFQSVFCLQIV